VRPNRHYQTHLPFLAVLIAMAGCATMADVRPGHGRITEISGFTYEQVWAAALRVAATHFKVREADEAKGVIRAERDVDVWSWGEWVGIFITPRAAGASSYDWRSRAERS